MPWRAPYPQPGTRATTRRAWSATGHGKVHDLPEGHVHRAVRGLDDELARGADGDRGSLDVLAGRSNANRTADRGTAPPVWLQNALRERPRVGASGRRLHQAPQALK